MDFQQIRDFVNPAVAQATGMQEVENLSMPIPVAHVPVQLVIDGALSLTSENPVQNKVIAVAIQNLDGRITAIEGQFSEGVTEAVNNWLAAHPEATTTVQDGAITYAKLDTNLKGEVDQISELKSATSDLRKVTIGKNLCGMDINTYYPVNIKGTQYVTMSTSDGSNMMYGSYRLLLFNENKEQINYLTFPNGNSYRTIDTNFTNVKYMRWSRAYPVPLQVELGQAKTDYEPYWGNPVIEAQPETKDFNIFNRSLIEKVNLIQDDLVLDLKYLNVANGSVSTVTNEKYQATEQQILIEPSTEYYFGVFDKGGSPKAEHSALTLCFYTSADAFISTGGCYLSNGIEGTNCSAENGMMKCTSPANAKYAKVGANTRLYGFKFFLCKKSVFDHYVEHNAIKAIYVGTKSKLNGIKVAVFGDSIMGNTRDYTNPPSQIGSDTGMTVYNFAFGGCRMSVHSGDWDKCSMYRLADDIYNESFSDLLTAVSGGWSGMPGYFVNVAKELSETDFSDIDVIYIAYGANDYTEPSSTLDNDNDKYDTTTVCGALRYSIKKIQQKYPRIQFLVSDPLFRVFLDNTTHEVLYTSEEHDFGSGTLVDYAEAYKNACKDMMVPFLDLHYESGFNEFTREYFFQENDGTHPNEKGYKRLANLISGKLYSLFPVK